MNNKHDLKSLSDDELLRRVSELVAQSRRIEWVLVAHIAEVDARRLYARRASPSMFQYCLDVFHLSEAEAFRRIAAARVSQRYPVVLQMLEDGRLHLAGISVLKKHLTDANCEEVLARATHKTIEEIKVLVAALSPKQDVPPSIRKRPQRKTKPEPKKSSVQLCSNTGREKKVTLTSVTAMSHHRAHGIRDEATGDQTSEQRASVLCDLPVATGASIRDGAGRGARVGC